MSSPWLLTLKDEQPTLVEGLTWTFWMLPPHDRASGRVRRRGDGQPFTPVFSAGDEAFIYQLGPDRVIAMLLVHGLRWDNEDELFYVDSTVEVLNADGPTLTEIGVRKAVQGGRQRLLAHQRDAAAEALGNAEPDEFTLRVETAAAPLIAKWRRDGWLVHKLRQAGPRNDGPAIVAARRS